MRTVEFGGFERDTPAKEMIAHVKDWLDNFDEVKEKVVNVFGEGYLRGSRAFALMETDEDMWTVLRSRRGHGRLRRRFLPSPSLHTPPTWTP